MPTTPLHILTWSQDHLSYALATQGQPVQMFAPEDTDTWQTWLATATSFTFRGGAGRLNVYHEARGETTHYWYAYQTTGKRTRKRFMPVGSCTKGAMTPTCVPLARGITGMSRWASG